MNTFVKYPQRQDCDLKSSAGNSGETSINLATDIATFLNDGIVLSKGDEKIVSFVVYKEDFIKALCHIIEKLPLYRTSSNSSTKVEYNDNLFITYMKSIDSFFKDNASEIYNATLSAVSAPRYYLKNLNDRGLNVRKFLIENNSTLHFSKDEDNFVLRLLSGEVKSKENEIVFTDTPIYIPRTLLCGPCIEKGKGINGFLDEMIPIVLDKDANLSRLSERFTSTSSKDNLLVDKFWLGRSRSKIEDLEEAVRKGHINQNVVWDYNGSSYVLNREQTFETFEIFKNIFNDTYKGIFEIVIETKEHNGEQRKHYYLYADGSASPAQSPFSPSTLIEKIKSTGLIYSDDLVKRFAYALMTKPFVILSGLAGSGKTQLALAFAECMSEDVERQVCVVSVGADWTNREPLLGYPNALKNNEYVMPECGALDMLIEANENPSKPYFLILDEMNLSVVERYFADFLSAMESKRPIVLWKGAADGKSKSRVLNEIMLPKNLYIIGTINVDETTYMFSPKVLDRAHVIEFKIAADEMASFLEVDKMVNRHACRGACAGMAEDFLARTNACAVGADTSNVQDTLNGFFKELKSVNAEFGYRTASEIYRYINNVGDELGEHGAIDTAILQKLLPKLHGSRKKLAPVLNALWKLCFAENSSISIERVKEFAEVEGIIYKHTAEKIFRMYKAVVDNGFTSFAEA